MQKYPIKLKSISFSSCIPDQKFLVYGKLIAVVYGIFLVTLVFMVGFFCVRHLQGNGTVKVKLSLCLTKCHTMKAYWGSGGIAPCIL